jgi:GT2 family glycosyltransferase
VISVVIPTRSRGQLLFTVLGGLDAQHGIERRAMEVVVVVDGAEKETAEQVRKGQWRYRLRVVEIPHAGPAAARDAGWQVAEGPLIVFLDDDVVPSPGLIAEHLAAHRLHGSCVVLGRVEPPPGRRPPWTAYDDRVLARKYGRLAHEEIPSGIHYGGNVSLPRELLCVVGGHDHVLQQDADVELGDRLRALGVRFVYHRAALGVHHGSVDYRTWRQRYFLHGRWDVALRRDRGLSGGLPGLLACYYDRHVLNRLAIRAGLGQRTGDKGGLVDLVAAAGALAYRLRLDGVSYAAFSCAANLLYWSGVRDGMRGGAAFWKAVRSVRRHSGRPYRAAVRGRQ